MAKGQLHLAPQGPAPCDATVGDCPYEAGGHYDSPQDAEQAFGESMGGSLPAAASKSVDERPVMIALDSGFGRSTVIDGDLSDPRARVALSSGLCGDLALAIHLRTGGTPYFVSFDFEDESDLAKHFDEEHEYIFDGTTHVVIESPSVPGRFVDTYGQQTAESLDEFYGGAKIIRGTPEMLNYYANREDASRLDSFARSALELDAKGELYSHEFDVLGEVIDEDYEQDEYLENEGLSPETASPASPKTVALQLDFGPVEVANGDLSDPKTRFYFANGLCGDLAMAIQERQGGRAYFAVDGSLSSEELERAAAEGRLGEHVAHAFVESKHQPGMFLDGYGVKSREEIEGFYDLEIREVEPRHLQAYGSGQGGRRGAHDLSAFAETVERFDREGVSHSYSDFG